MMGRLILLLATAGFAASAAARADTVGTVTVAGYVCPSADQRCPPGGATLWQPTRPAIGISDPPSVLPKAPDDAHSTSTLIFPAVPTAHLLLVPEGDCHDGDVVEFFHGEMRCAPRSWTFSAKVTFPGGSSVTWSGLTERECDLVKQTITLAQPKWLVEPDCNQSSVTSGQPAR